MGIGEPKTVVTRAGRELAYAEVGDPNGPLVIHNHGGPSSRLEARFFAESASRNRLRLICVDRPGMGQSSPQHARSYAGWAADLVAIADALGGTLALRFNPGFRLMYAALALVAKRFPGPFMKQLLSSVNDYDRQVLAQADNASVMKEAGAECFAHGSGELVRDSELLYRSWAFDVAKISRPVHMWQGTDDRLVTDSINKAVADAMPGAVWHPAVGAGHFVAVDVFAIAAVELGA